MKRVIVTSSWDDGHILDMRLCELLKKYDIAGTLYISPKNREFLAEHLLQEKHLKALARDFEIGSHTMTHPVLTHVSIVTSRKEITTSKDYLEKLLRRRVTSFCYPRGAYDERLVNQVQRAGYSYARTTDDYETAQPKNPFLAAATVEAYRFSRPAVLQELRKLARYCAWKPWRMVRYIGWERRAKRMFDDVCATGGVYHLWGHSWVVEQAGDWQKLERVLAYIHGRSGVTYTTNAKAYKAAKS